MYPNNIDLAKMEEAELSLNNGETIYVNIGTGNLRVVPEGTPFEKHEYEYSYSRLNGTITEIVHGNSGTYQIIHDAKSREVIFDSRPWQTKL